jgi:hypothetical protein
MRTRRLIREEHDARLSQNTCPRCKKHTLTKKLLDVSYGKLKGGMPFWACSGPLGHECYYISDGASDPLFESSEGTVPVNPDEKPPVPEYVPRVIRRPRNTGKKYQLVHH